MAPTPGSLHVLSGAAVILKIRKISVQSTLNPPIRAGRGRVEMHKGRRLILPTLPFPGENSEKSKNLQFEPSGLVSSEYLCESRIEQILSVDKLNFECLH